MQQALLVLAHGSRDQEARAEYGRLAELLATRLPEAAVRFGVLEFPGDGLLSIGQAVAACVEAGAERIVALPYFLFAAGHVRDDLPGELRRAAAAWPGLSISYQPPMGVDPAILDVLQSRADEAGKKLPPETSGPTALVLVGAGTSDPEANADLYRAARLLWERRRFQLVEVAFVSLTGPSIAETLNRCLALGARRLLVAPYFLNTGVLSRRLAARLEASRAGHPEVEVALAGELGLHPRMIDLLVTRARLGLQSSVQACLELPPCSQPAGIWSCWLGSGGARRSGESLG